MRQLRAGRPEAAAIIWNWDGSDSAEKSAGSSSRTRLKGSIQGVAAGAMGALLYLYWSQTVGRIVMGLGTVILLSALVSPTGLYRLVERLLAALGLWTGRAINWILLVPLFYLFFLPFGLLFRRNRSDRLRRYTDPEASTYWEPHEGITAASDLRERQY